MKYLIFIIIVLSSQIFSQEKYFIYFNDKGSESSSLLNKTSDTYLETVQNLSQRSIERRKKNMGEDIITYEDLPIYQNYLDELEKLNVQIIRKLTWFNSVSAFLSAEQIELVIKLPFIKSVEPVRKLYFRNDLNNITENPLYKISETTYNYGPSYKQNNLSDIPFIHSKNISGQNVIIGVLDTGFDWKLHNSLKDRQVIAEYDFIFNDSVTSNQSGDNTFQHNHGTYVFSILAGYADSILIGPAFNSSFILAKTEDIRSETHIEEDNYAAALIWMESLGVDITTGSLGYNTFDTGYSYTYADMDGKTTIITKAANLAFERGVSTFTSAGNEGSNSWGYIIAPADAFNIIAVGASNDLGNAASFSSHGPTYDGRIKPEVIAYGVSNWGATAGTENGYGFNSGTSAAAPIACGVGALLLSAYPHLKNTQIRSILLESSSNSATPNNNIGYGIISAKNAIEFPNLEYVNGRYVLHKTIFDEHVNPQSVNVVVSYDDIVLPDEQMNRSDLYNYSVPVPQIINGKQVKFYFTYSDSLNNNYRSPLTGEFKFNYGSEIISNHLEIPNIAGNYQVSDFYPNPFIPANHKNTSFNYYTSGNEILKVLIIDGAGQKVKEIITTTASEPGFYPIGWDGYSEQGYLCASGVYYALIQLGGKEYGKKLVLLK